MNRRSRSKHEAPLIVATQVRGSDKVLYSVPDIHAALYSLGSGRIRALSGTCVERTFAAILQQVMLEQTPEMGAIPIDSFIESLYELVEHGLFTADGVVNFPIELL